MPDADLVIDVPLDPVPGEQEEAAKTEAAPEAVEAPPAAPAGDEPVENLKQQLEALKRASAEEIERAKAEAAAARAEAAKKEEEIARTRTELTDSNVSALEAAIAAAQAEADALAKEQEHAFSAGEFAKAAEIGRKLARAEAKVLRYEEGKADIEARKAETAKAKPADTGTARPDPAKPADPFEAMIANNTPRAQAWLRQHRDYVLDQAKAQQAVRAHWAALGEGHVVDSDAYFDFVERRLGLKEDKEKETPSAAPAGSAKPAPERPRAAPATAPVTRDATPSGGALSQTAVKLTPAEQARATDGTIVWNYTDEKIGAVKGKPIGLKEYARRKAIMESQGLYNRAYTDQ